MKTSSSALAMLAAGVTLAATLFAACGGDGEKSVEGIVIEVDADTLTTIDSFTVRTNDGELLVFVIAPEAAPDPQESFVPSHLRSHRVLVEQVEVFFREEDGQLFALRLVHR